MNFEDFLCSAFFLLWVLQEKSMLNALQFNMSVPTPFVFMRRFLKAAEFDYKVKYYWFCDLCVGGVLIFF